MPPLRIVVPLSVPPEVAMAVPPLLIVALMSVPPEETSQSNPAVDRVTAQAETGTNVQNDRAGYNDRTAGGQRAAKALKIADKAAARDVNVSIVVRKFFGNGQRLAGYSSTYKGTAYYGAADGTADCGANCAHHGPKHYDIRRNGLLLGSTKSGIYNVNRDVLSDDIRYLNLRVNSPAT